MNKKISKQKKVTVVSVGAMLLFSLFMFSFVQGATTNFQSGFERGISDWTGEIGNGVTVGNTHVYEGNYALEADTNHEWVLKDGFNAENINVTFALLIETPIEGSACLDMLTFRSGNGGAPERVCNLALDQIGFNVACFKTNGYSISGSQYYATQLTPNTWHNITVILKVGAVGEANFWFDGTQQITLTNVDTGLKPITRVGLGSMAGCTNPPHAWFDKVFINDKPLQPTQTPTPTINPTATPTDTPQPTPEPTFFQTPTPTLNPTPTSNPSPTVDPQKEMTETDWADFGQWIANGSALQTYQTITGK